MIGVFCDCHNTLILSNEAWIEAFCEVIGEKYRSEIEKILYGKYKRREIAKKYGVEFSLIEKAANKYMKKNEGLVEILNELRNYDIKLFVISNAPRYRVEQDLKNVGIYELFSEVYTGDEGGKSNLKLFDDLLERYQLRYGLFIGNEEYDDDICHPQIVSLAITKFLKIRNAVLADYIHLDTNGKIY